MTEQRDSRSAAQIDAVDRIRSSLASGFAFVRGREVAASISAITFEECLSSAIEDIEVDDSDIRKSKLSEVRRVREETLDAVDQARKMPASLFVYRDEQGAANTSVEEEND